jgi:hypothetical protein
MDAEWVAIEDDDELELGQWSESLGHTIEGQTKRIQLVSWHIMRRDDFLG